MQQRKILHIDMDAFYASVEQRDNSDIRGKPVVVGGRPESRGVVAACSYEARKFGIHSAMPSSRAVKLCPELIFIQPRFDAYQQASQQIRAVFTEFTELIEPLSLDEAYLDVSEASLQLGSATQIARSIKHKIKQTVNLTASAGVSYNKFLAKIASDMDKPDGLYVIRPQEAPAFIKQLQIRKFFGIGKVTEKKMQGLGIYTGADLKKLSLVQLQTHFGSSGQYYYNIARGIDERPVIVHSVRKSISKETTFAENVVNKKLIWESLQKLSTRLGELMQLKKIKASTVTLKMKYSDFQLITRSKTGPNLSQTKEDILSILPELLKKTEVGHRSIRLIGINLSGLIEAELTDTSFKENDKIQDSEQLGLF